LVNGLRIGLVFSDSILLRNASAVIKQWPSRTKGEKVKKQKQTSYIVIFLEVFNKRFALFLKVMDHFPRLFVVRIAHFFPSQNPHPISLRSRTFNLETAKHFGKSRTRVAHSGVVIA
jgi:hypothetical protein